MGGLALSARALTDDGYCCDTIFHLAILACWEWDLLEYLRFSLRDDVEPVVLGVLLRDDVAAREVLHLEGVEHALESRTRVVVHVFEDLEENVSAEL